MPASTFAPRQPFLRESGFIYLTAIRAIDDRVAKGVGRSTQPYIYIDVDIFLVSGNDAFETRNKQTYLSFIIYFSL